MIRKREDWTVQMKKKQIRKMNELIEKEIKQHKAKITMKMAQTLQSENKMHAGTFYEFKRQMDRQEKGEAPSVMINKEGKEVTNRNEIREVYADFYQNLFEQDKPTDDIEEKADKVRQIVFDNIMKEAERPVEKEKITKHNIQKSIKKTKNKTSLDYDKISNKIIKCAGKDFQESIEILFNEINRTNTGPEAWANMIIKSIYKGKNSRKEMNNRRGLFITSVISKLFERTKLEKHREIIERMISKFQTGGIQGKCPLDNKMVLNAIIDYNIFINSETYVFFADAYKCFDKLDLKTSLIDLYEILGAHEAKLLYDMNKKANITIKTPVGETKPIQVKEITKQGTLYGPILCDINTDKVNKIGTKNISTIGPNIECEASIYVDDIEHAGSHINITERAAMNCRSMEEMRKFTFNNEVEKTAFMILKPKKKSKNIEELHTKIKRGTIRRTK